MNAALLMRIIARWLHIVPAAILIGGALFMAVLLPVGLRALDPAARLGVMVRVRRVFKIVVHTCILLLLISGTINTVLQWRVYSSQPGLMHGLWGGHVVLALSAMAVAVTLLLGAEPSKSAARWTAINFAILLAVALLASSLKQVRDRAVATPPPAALPR